MEIVQYDKPVDRVRAFIRDYARELYGIENASALMPLVEVAFDPAARHPERIRAASELLKYSEVPTRSIEYDGGKTGPDLEVTVIGAIEIEAPEYGPTADTKQLVPPPTSDSPVELLDEGREEGS
jgi:hypothetical protein